LYVPPQASEGPKSLAPGPRLSGRPQLLAGPVLVVNNTHSSSRPQNSCAMPLVHAFCLTLAASSGWPSPLQSVSMYPLPSVSLEVSILPLPLRSMQLATSLAILVTADWPPNARLDTQMSPLKSTAVRDGLLDWIWICW